MSNSSSEVPKNRLSISSMIVVILFTTFSIGQNSQQNIQGRQTVSSANCGPSKPISGSSAQVDKYMKLAAEAYKRGDYKEDFRQVEHAAALGDWGAQRILGLMYLRGKGTQVNMNMAAACLTSAANQGDPNAKVELAIMYALGMSPFQMDYKRAFQLADEVAKAGQPAAFCKLGQAVANQIPPDLPGAVQFFDAGIARGEKQYCADGRAQITRRAPSPGQNGGNPTGVDCSSYPMCVIYSNTSGGFPGDPNLNSSCAQRRNAWNQACGSR